MTAYSGRQQGAQGPGKSPAGQPPWEGMLPGPDALVGGLCGSKWRKDMTRAQNAILTSPPRIADRKPPVSWLSFLVEVIQSLEMGLTLNKR